MLIAVVVVAVGAGAFVLLSGDDDSQRGEYVDALTTGYAAGIENEDNPVFAGLTEDDIRCMAEVTVDTVGLDRLAEEHTPDDLRRQFDDDPDFDLEVGDDPTEEEAGQMVDGMNRCWDFFEKLREQFRSEFANDPRFTEEIMGCMVDALNDDFLRAAMTDDFLEKPGADMRTATSRQFESQCGHLLR